MTPFASLASPAWIVLQLLERCNLRCEMCYEWGDTGAYHGQSTLAELDPAVVVRALAECLSAKPFFEFFGGEPLLYPGIWDLITLIRQAGCDLAFPTNGTLVERYADRIVATEPNLLWISLDGPLEVNDRQRGRGVFAKVMLGIEKLTEVRRAQGKHFPELGIAYIVTPRNYPYIEEFFLKNVDLSLFSFISVELQSYATEAQYSAYLNLLSERFGVQSAPCAKAYVRDPAIFADMDAASIAGQISRVRAACATRGIRFFSQPRTLTNENLKSYLNGDWDRMTDRRSRCGVPWAYAEVSARGDVTTCHTFYDLPIGNIYEQTLLEIWRGNRLRAVRDYLREGLFPICTACCRYYSGAAPIATSKPKAAVC
jgi:radical SAM protein with 4Fe4S-binding SPASM domain